MFLAIPGERSPAMAQAGIRYFSAAPNYFDRIGTFMVEWKIAILVDRSLRQRKSACLDSVDRLCNVTHHAAGHTVGQQVPSQTG